MLDVVADVPDGVFDGDERARRTDLRVRMPNHASSMLSQEAPVGVKWKHTLGWHSSHVRTSGVEWVEELSRITCSSRRR